MAVVNVYLNAYAGLGPHQDSKRFFQRPIASLRLFANSILSFGGKKLTMDYPMFEIPLERGVITIMEVRVSAERQWTTLLRAIYVPMLWLVMQGYAADMHTHCIRPDDTKEGILQSAHDMSASIILRQCVLISLAGVDKTAHRLLHVLPI